MSFTQSEYLTLLTHAPADAVKELAESILPALGSIHVLKNATGLIMLPYQDSAGGVTFHLGEVLVSEAHLQIEIGTQGYALVIGRDLVLAIAIAVLDAALQAGVESVQIEQFLSATQNDRHMADQTILAQVEQTRVEMETF